MAQLFRKSQLSTINLALCAICIILIILALWTNLRMMKEHLFSHDTTATYLRWEAAAQQMQTASEYLSIQARQYVKTLRREHALNYLNEFYHNRKREEAINLLNERGAKDYFDSDGLTEALAQSDALAQKELYAIKLVATALEDKSEQLQSFLKDINITESDLALNKDKKIEKASALVHNMGYDADQKKIMDSIHYFIKQCSTYALDQEHSHVNALSRQMIEQRILLVALLCAICFLCWHLWYSGASRKRRGS